MKRAFRILLLILLTTAILVGVSCVKKTATLSQLEFRDAHGDSIFMDGEPFNGTAWSNDHKTMKLTILEGKVTEFYIYHKNGKVACSGGRDAKGHYAPHFFTDSGKEYTDFKGLEKEFFSMYPEVRNALISLSIGTPNEKHIKLSLSY